MNRHILPRCSSATKRIGGSRPQSRILSSSTTATTTTTTSTQDGSSSPAPSSSPPPPTPHLSRSTLPLSPLMLPTPNPLEPPKTSSRTTKTSHHPPKLPPTKTPTPFQLSLSKNPYARALATPIRVCQITKTVLPSFFLQDFQMVEDPRTDTDEVWYLPRSLGMVQTQAQLQAQAQARVGDGAGEGKGGKEGKVEAGLHVETHSEVIQTGGQVQTQVPPPSIGPKVYLLAREQAVKAASDVDSGFGRNRYRKFASPRFLSMTKAVREKVEKVRWREDMDSWVGELMRRRVVEALVYLGGLKRGYVGGCAGWEEVEVKYGVGVVLWMGGEDGDGPGEFETYILRGGKKVPVYNMVRLLGEKHIEELRKMSPNGLWERKLVVIRHKRVTVETLLKLWKLQGYVAGFEKDELNQLEAREENEEDNAAG